MSWVCKKCGPVRGYIPGGKGEPRCPSDGCDLVLGYEGIDRPAKSFMSTTGPPPAAVAKKLSKASAENLREQAKSAREGRAILARVKAREKAMAPGRTVNDEEEIMANDTEDTKITEDAKAARKKARVGACGKCGQSRWLLSKIPPLCKPCFAAENPDSVRPRKPWKKKAKEEDADGLAREVKATEAVARELSGLTPGAVRRVLRFALEHVAEALCTQPRLLLSFDAPREPSAGRDGVGPAAGGS